MSVTKVGAALLESGSKGADIASASTMVIGKDGSYFDITGTTGIGTMTVDAGRIFTLQFDGAVVLTHSSTLYLAGAANFTTEANDHLTFVAVAANDVRQIGAGLKDGGSPIAGGGAWTALATTTASGDASIAFTSSDGINHSLYARYLITGHKIVPSGDNNLNVRLSDDNGSTYEADGGDYAWGVHATDQDGATSQNYSPSSQEIGLLQTSQESTGIGIYFNLTWCPEATATAGSYELFWDLTGEELNSGDRMRVMGGGGTLNAAGDSGGFDAIQFLGNTGTITSGIFNLYGLTKPS